MEIRIERSGNQLIVPIPRAIIRPKLTRKWVTGRMYHGGRVIEIPATLPLGAIDTPSGRRPVNLRKSFLNQIRPGLDYTKEIVVRPGSIGLGYGDPLHAFFAGDDRLRVWIPAREIQRLRLSSPAFNEIPVRIYATTKPGEEQVGRWETIEDLRVYHLGRHYDATKIGNEWFWYIPEKIEYKPPGLRPEMELYPEQIFRAGPAPNAECWDAGEGEVTIELGFYPDSTIAKNVSRVNGFAFRNIANRNYSLKDVDSYPFYCELRASFITVYPREFIEILDAPKGAYLTHLIGKTGVLGITLRNMVNWILIKRVINEETSQQKIVHYLYSGKLKRTDYQTRWVATPGARRTAGRTRMTAGGGANGRNPPADIVAPGTWENEEILLTEGLEINEMIDELKFTGFEFERCVKYARMVNRQLYYYVYDNNYIENQVRVSPEVYLDRRYRFLWTHIQYLYRGEEG